VGRAFGTVAVLLVVCAALPQIASLAQAAVPALISLLVCLGLLRLALPPRPRR
jgi:hypothetical protein